MSKVLTNDLKMFYEQSIKKYCNFTDDYFVVSNAFPIGNTAMYFRITKIAEAAGLKKIRLHDFRHSCASLLINSGANVTLVAKFLGLSKIEETLNTYIHLYTNALSDIIKLIDKMNES